MPAGWKTRQAEGVCLDGKPDGECGGEPVTLSGSVGSGGMNRSDDVRKVQEALNRVPPEKGGPVPPLVVDGLCGPKTTAAIWKFQKTQGVPADGRIDPGQATIAKLNTVLGASGPASSDRRDRVIGFLAQALETVRAARANILAAMPFLPEARTPGGSPAPAGGISALGSPELLEKHFGISEQAAPKETTGRILTIYERMLMCFARPGGLWGPAIFEDDPYPPSKPKKGVAMTYAGGWDLGGKRDGSLRQDSIYLFRRLDLLPPDQVIMTIVHELAHYVGPTVIGIVDDHAYGWVDGTRMKTLPAAWRPYNAECYNNFAFDAKYHRTPARPPVP